MPRPKSSKRRPDKEKPADPNAGNVAVGAAPEPEVEPGAPQTDSPEALAAAPATSAVPATAEEEGAPPKPPAKPAQPPPPGVTLNLSDLQAMSMPALHKMARDFGLEVVVIF